MHPDFFRVLSVKIRPIRQICVLKRTQIKLEPKHPCFIRENPWPKKTEPRQVAVAAIREVVFAERG
jgi:hypothetical protein